MKPMMKKSLLGAAALLGILSLGAGGYVLMNVRAFDASMSKTWDVPTPKIERSTDPAVLARGKHLVESAGACSASDCHGKDLSGGKPIDLGPLGTVTGPNITGAGNAAAYTDGQIARLMRYGVKASGQSAVFMPTHEMNWMNDDDITAVVSYVRSVPKVEKPNGPIKVGVLAKILDRRGNFVMDVARKVSESGQLELAGKPEPTAAYGRFLAKGCTGCHGATLSGGPIPGAPPDMPVPLNITPHETGMKGWSQADFNHLLATGDRKNGKKLAAFMPIENLNALDETEKTALFLYLQSVPPKAFGGR